MSGVSKAENGPGLTGVADHLETYVSAGESRVEHDLLVVQQALGNLSSSIEVYDRIPGAPESDLVEKARAIVYLVGEKPPVQR